MKIKDYVDELEDKNNIIETLDTIIDVDLPNCRDALANIATSMCTCTTEKCYTEMEKYINEITGMFIECINNITVTVNGTKKCLEDEIEQIRETIV